MIAPNEPNANVVFHQAALGDFVLTWPLLRAMTGPTVVVAPWGKAKLGAQVLDHVEPMDIEMLEFTRLHAAGGPTHVSPAVGELFERARRIVSFISPGGDDWADNVARRAPGAKLLFVRPRPAADWERHVCAWHEAQLERQGWALKGKPAVRVVERDGPVVIHPGSGGPHKNWPADRYAELIDKLRKAGRPVRVICGEAEPVELVTALQATPLQTLDELVVVLGEASCYVGNDAGPTHLAAQLGLPTVALFGPTPPLVWAPVGPAVTVLAPPEPTGMGWLSVSDVLNAIPRP